MGRMLVQEYFQYMKKFSKVGLRVKEDYYHCHFCVRCSKMVTPKVQIQWDNLFRHSCWDNFQLNCGPIIVDRATCIRECLTSTSMSGESVVWIGWYAVAHDSSHNVKRWKHGRSLSFILIFFLLIQTLTKTTMYWPFLK